MAGQMCPALRHRGGHGDGAGTWQALEGGRPFALISAPRLTAGANLLRDPDRYFPKGSPVTDAVAQSAHTLNVQSVPGLVLFTSAV